MVYQFHSIEILQEADPIPSPISPMLILEWFILLGCPGQDVASDEGAVVIRMVSRDKRVGATG